jgi:DNA-directed RNA polymerase specialized sigma24 family protein
MEQAARIGLALALNSEAQPTLAQWRCSRAERLQAEVNSNEVKQAPPTLHWDRLEIMVDDNPNNRIDGVVTESRIAMALGKTIPSLGDQATAEERERREAERREQMCHRERFLKKYQLAIMAYLTSMLRDADYVNEVWHAFVVKMYEGQLSSYDARHGSFHVFLKTILYNDVQTFWRRLGRDRQKGPGPLPSSYDPVDEDATTASVAFDQGLRNSLIERAIDSIKQEDSLHHATLKALMLAVADGIKPLSSKEMADHLSRVSCTIISPAYARQLKRRAQQLFAKKLIDEVALLLGTTNHSQIKQALDDLELARYCNKMLSKLASAADKNNHD